MAYIPVITRPTVVYHFTKKENLDSILRSGTIYRMGDSECWFCKSLEDSLDVMKTTVMQPEKPYIKVGGSIGRYPEFHAEEYVIIKLIPKRERGVWVRWMDELSSNTAEEVRKAHDEFCKKKIGFRGDLHFHSPEIYDVATLLSKD